MKFKPLPELNRAIEAIEAARKTVFLKKVGMTVNYDGVCGHVTPLGIVIASTLRFFLVEDETWDAWVRGDVTFDALCVVGVTVKYDENRDGWTMEAVK